LNLTPKVLQVPRQPAAQAQRQIAAPQANKPQTAPSRAPTSDRPQTLQLRLPFAYNSSTLNSQAEAELLRALAPVSGHVQTVQIIGVADSLQRDQYNLALAQRRADAVAMFLRPHLGTATFSTSARVFKVPAEGYPPDEPHNARRADLSVLLITDPR
jgi:outer membrane protein OmpA-like peptidoglycan-associated protein